MNKDEKNTRQEESHLRRRNTEIKNETFPYLDRERINISDFSFKFCFNNFFKLEKKNRK